MGAVAFDTLKLADGLEKAGFTREQATGAAKVLAESFSSELATKADIAALRAELKGDIAGVKGEITAVRGEVGSLRTELKGDIAKLGGDLRGEIAAAQISTVRWIVGAVVLNFVGVAGLVLAVVRFARL